jgi:bifunctional pyridoxal-dependent enzyme with beta-cystathionase and maltose regulon repressor activities
VRTLEEHVGDSIFEVLLCNENLTASLKEGDQWVEIDNKTLSDSRAHFADLINESQPWRHDSTKLAETLISILDEYTGPLE